MKPSCEDVIMPRREQDDRREGVGGGALWGGGVIGEDVANHRASRSDRKRGVNEIT